MWTGQDLTDHTYTHSQAKPWTDGGAGWNEMQSLREASQMLS